MDNERIVSMVNVGGLEYDIHDKRLTAKYIADILDEANYVPSGSADYRATINVNLQAVVNGTVTNYSLNGATVSVQNTTDNDSPVTQTWAGQTLVFNNLTPLKDYSITVTPTASQNSTYTAPAAQSVSNIGIGSSLTKTFEFTADEYTISISSNQGVNDSAISSAKVVYGSNNYDASTPILVPTGTSVVVDGASANVTATSISNYRNTLSMSGKAITSLYETEALIVNITAKDGDDNAVAADGATVTINGTTYTLTSGQDNVTKSGTTWTIVTKVAFGTTYSVSATGITDYDDPASQTDITADNISRTINLEFVEIVGVTIILTTTDSTSNAGISITLIDSSNVSHTETTNSNGHVLFTDIPDGTCTLSALKGDTKYTLSTYDITVNSSNKQFNINCAVLQTGVYAYYSDGSLKSLTSNDTTAIGVAVVTNNCSFVIDKVATNNNNYEYYGGYNKDLSKIGVMVAANSNTAKTDFKGEANTTAIINACKGYTNSNITGAPAAEKCRAAFVGKGYMGALGEWNEAYNNKAAVNAMMTRIGGTAILDNYHWSSTLYNASGYSWGLHWGDGYTGYDGRFNGGCVRAFRAL